MDIDVTIADIITQELGISASRVVVYGQNFQSPKDEGLYIVILTKNDHPVGSTNRFDEDTLEEVKSVSMFVDIEIELTSKDRTAYEIKEEVIMALTSTYSVQKQEELKFKLFRGDILDLTFIEGSSSLYRFLVKVRASYLKVKRTELTSYIEHYREPEVLIESQ